MTKSSEAYRDQIDPSLYYELTEEQDLEIIGKPFEINELCGICLVPVRDDVGHNCFAFCQQREVHVILDTEEMKKIKAFDTTPYKQGSNNGA